MILDDYKRIESEEFAAKGKEVWSFLDELNSNYTTYELLQDDRPIFDGIMNILDLIEIEKGYEYRFSSIHEAFAGYFTTISVHGECMKEKDAAYDVVSIGLKPKVGFMMSSMAIWQIYLFCMFYRGIESAGWYSGTPIFEISDLDFAKLTCSNDDQTELLKHAFSQLRMEETSLLPQVTEYTANMFDTHHQVKCTWWFPSKGLVTETINFRFSIFNEQKPRLWQKVLIPKN